MTHPAGEAPLIGSPLKMSGTPVSYRRPPPTLGQHTDEVLKDLLALGDDERGALRQRGVI
jgi:crotonobetainyl-CoA:carnitine CoA-transferase CaiB-like acyl-CoA transferase